MTDGPVTDSTVPRSDATRGLPKKWYPATLVDRRSESASAASLVFHAPGLPAGLAGQRVEIRLTAEDGYSAQRAYSLSRVGLADVAEVAVQATPSGEISPFLVHRMAVGDQAELRGPVGGWFTWEPQQTEPLLLVGGGSGITPLMAILRERRRILAAQQLPSPPPIKMVYSVRNPEDAWFAGELVPQAGEEIVIAYTRSAPRTARRPVGRVHADDLRWHSSDVESATVTGYVCGPSGFVEHTTQILEGLGVQPARIRTERFGWS